ncbi:MAG: DUF1802 family protein [Verrucomicrobiae bacterium]|nr:DUF1802 family protein [Verrucomicrobiae bacterium]
MTCTSVAFKEWAILVERFGRGEQILILRKGGIHEKRGGFEVEHRGFFLFPTLFHQQLEGVVPEARVPLDLLATAGANPKEVKLEFWAEVTDAHWITDEAALDRLRPFHAWTREVVRERFEYGTEPGIFALVVRVFRVAGPKTFALKPEHGGCRSWLELKSEETPSLERKKPALSDLDFESRRAAIAAALPMAAAR